MSAIVPALKDEIAQLEADLRNDPRQRKLERLRATLAEYEPSASLERVRIAPVNGASKGLIFEASGPAPRNKQERIKAELITLFTEHGGMHRTKILDHLVAKEVMGSEKDPLAALAAYLSGLKDVFDFDGKGNWSLKPK